MMCPTFRQATRRKKFCQMNSSHNQQKIRLYFTIIIYFRPIEINRKYNCKSTKNNSYKVGFYSLYIIWRKNRVVFLRKFYVFSVKFTIYSVGNKTLNLVGKKIFLPIYSSLLGRISRFFCKFFKS